MFELNSCASALSNIYFQEPRIMYLQEVGFRWWHWYFQCFSEIPVKWLNQLSLRSEDLCQTAERAWRQLRHISSLSLFRLVLNFCEASAGPKYGLVSGITLYETKPSHHIPITFTFLEWKRLNCTGKRAQHFICNLPTSFRKSRERQNDQWLSTSRNTASFLNILFGEVGGFLEILISILFHGKLSFTFSNFSRQVFVLNQNLL